MSPAVPKLIALALSRHPPAARARLLQIRSLIFQVAAETEGVGALTETLKWGEPAYLTEATKSGTTIRLGVSKLAPEECALFFNCQTSLVEDFKAYLPKGFAFEGKRAIVVPVSGRLPPAALTLCLRAALTYHSTKGSRFRV